jgi:hypothetical protein
MRIGSAYLLCIRLVAILVTLSACTERFDIRLDSTYQRLVVEGSITTDSVKHSVILSLTGDYFSNRPSTRVQNAVVELVVGGDTLQLPESVSDPGRYETPYAFRGVIGTTYELIIGGVDINQDGEQELYHAKSRMPGGPELESIELRYYETPVVSGYTVLMYASHPVDQRDWFGFKLIKNSDLLTDSLAKYNVLSDDIFDSGYFPGLPVGFLDDGNPREALHPGDTITFELNCIDEAYYNFVTEAQLEIAGNYPLFSGPPANISSNIDNGAEGIFAAYSVQRLSLVLP